MRHKKIASLLAIATLSLTTPFFSIPRANAFHSSITFPTDPSGGLVFQDYSDPKFGAGTDAAREGSTVSFTVVIRTDSDVGQRNITVGVKFDWMTGWVNASDAGPANTLEVGPDSYVTATVSVVVPGLTQNPGFNLYTHTWQMRVWSGALNSPSGAACDSDPGITGCQTSPTRSGFAIYSNDQADGLIAREDATQKINNLSIFIGGPGAAKAASDLGVAESERNLGDNYYGDGNFAAARTHYQNALNYANSAAYALSGGDAATYTNVLLGGIGTFLLGVGIFIAGVGGFLYLLRRPKMKMAQ